MTMISGEWISGFHRPYLIVIDENDNGGVGGNFFYGIKVSNGIDGNKGAVSPLTGTLPPRPYSLGAACQLPQPLFPPCPHEIVFLVIFGPVRTRALALLLRKVDLLVVHDVVGKVIDCLSEASFLSSLEGASVSYDSFRSGVGIELGCGGKIGSCRRHFGRDIRPQGLVVVVARIESGAVVI